MRARIYDPIGPWWLRLPLPLVGALLCGASLMAGERAASLGWLPLSIGLGLLALSRLWPPRFAERDAQLELGPGRVEVRGAGPLTQRIVATRVRAASTAQVEGGYAVALECPGRGRHPLVLRVESPSEVERICDALGVGYYGVGVLQWPGGGSGLPGLEHIVAWVAVLGCALLVAGAASPSLIDANLGLFALAVACVVTAAIVLVGLVTERLRRGPERSIALTKTGLDLSRMALPFQFLPYHLIEEVAETPDAVELTLTRPHGALRVPLHVPPFRGPGGARGDVAAFAAQVRTAARRARGDRAPERGVSPSVETLGRQGDPVKAWLERLDAA
ncbi:MAG TPA: hypothetical protein VFS00_02545, partial [Polyangiaceae bacterium]|nr:hypothetical protein [Polyangiaceae bacterium]